MSQANTKTVAVIDHGLMDASGHHAGFAAMVANSAPQQTGLNIEFICHERIDKELHALLERAGCQVRAELATNFYQYFKQTVSVPDIQPYLIQLSKEYIHTIKDISHRHANKDIIFFYPSLGWEHAYSLSLALSYLPHNPAVKHIACAMFNPCIDHQGKTANPQKKLNHAIGFCALDKHASVMLYASDRELSSIYADLLNREKPLPIHPCYLADWPSINTTKPASPETINVILYMGDAKENKGFCLLPGIANEILSDKTLDIELTVQYTLLWPDEATTNAATQLLAIAKDDKRLMLYSGFLSDNDLHSYLRKAQLFVFTYEADAYRNKNSGLLWLIGWHQTPVCFLHSSWLHREALRIELPIMNNNENWRHLRQRISETQDKQVQTEIATNKYRAELYRPFWDWIASAQ